MNALWSSRFIALDRSVYALLALIWLSLAKKSITDYYSNYFAIGTDKMTEQDEETEAEL